MTPAALLQLAELDVDAVRDDVARLERALAMARAVLAALEERNDAPITRTASPDLAASLLDETTLDVDDRLAGVVRNEREDRASLADPPADASHSSRPEAPAAGSTPPELPPAPPYPRHPSAFAYHKARTRIYLQDRAGAWVRSTDLRQALDVNQTSLTKYLAELAAEGLVEHNGRMRQASAYRAVTGEPAPLPLPPATPRPRVTPDDVGDRNAPAGPPPARLPAARMRDRAEERRAALAREAGAPPAEEEDRPGPPISGRLRRQLAAEERRLQALTATAPSALEVGEAANKNGTLAGRALNALSYRPGTLRDLAARLGLHDGELEELARVIAGLQRDQHVRRDNGRPAVYYSEELAAG